MNISILSIIKLRLTLIKKMFNFLGKFCFLDKILSCKQHQGQDKPAGPNSQRQDQVVRDQRLLCDPDLVL